MSKFAKQSADILSTVVNSTTFNAKEVAEITSKDHRYLQQELYKFCRAYIKEMADKDIKKDTDARNFWAVSDAKSIVGGGDDHDWSF